VGLPEPGIAATGAVPLAGLMGDVVADGVGILSRTTNVVFAVFSNLTDCLGK
jgi:hypothetical protein